MTTNSHDTKRKALGRGLEALLPSRTPQVAIQASEDQDHERAGQPIEIELDRIDRNPFQTRSQFDPEKLAELAQSIAATGVIQPVVVRTIAENRYQLVTGERRLIASGQAGKKTIPAVVRVVSDEQAMEMTIVENLQRADLNPMEQARAYQRLSHDFKMTQDQMAVRTGKDRTSVANFLRLLKLPEGVQKKVESGELSFGHARALLGLSGPQQIADAAQKVSALAMSVRQTESFVQGLMNPEGKAEKGKKVIEPLDPNVVEARDLLQRRLGLRVHIEDKSGKGRVIIDYANLEDFDLLLGAFGVRE